MQNTVHIKLKTSGVENIGIVENIGQVKKNIGSRKIRKQKAILKVESNVLGWLIQANFWHCFAMPNSVFFLIYFFTSFSYWDLDFCAHRFYSKGMRLIEDMLI